MLVYNVVAGATDVSVVLRIVDATDGTPETGVVFDTAGIDLQYRRELAASTAITEATLAALTTAHADGGFLHIGNGYYRFDLPDAAVATGSSGVLVHGTVTGMVVIGCYIHLTPFPVDVRQFGGTAGTFAAGRPEVNTTHAAGTAWGSGAITAAVIANGAIDAATFAAGAIDASAIADGAIDAATFAADAITAAKIASDVGDEFAAAFWNVADAEEAAVPAASAAFRDKVNFMFALARNKITQTATTFLLRDDADAATIATSTVSDDGTTFTRSELA